MVHSTVPKRTIEGAEKTAAEVLETPRPPDQNSTTNEESE